MPLLLESPGMSKQAKDPDEVVRFPASITAGERARLRIVAAHLGRPMEDVAGDWIRERLSAEEGKLGIIRPAKASRR